MEVRKQIFNNRMVRKTGQEKKPSLVSTSVTVLREEENGNTIERDLNKSFLLNQGRKKQSSSGQAFPMSNPGASALEMEH